MKIANRAALLRAINTPGIQITALDHWQPHLKGTKRTPKKIRNSGKPGIQTSGYYFDATTTEGKVVEVFSDIPKASALRFNSDGTVTFNPDTDRSWTLAFHDPEKERAA